MPEPCSTENYPQVANCFEPSHRKLNPHILPSHPEAVSHTVGKDHLSETYIEKRKKNNLLQLQITRISK